MCYILNLISYKDITKAEIIEYRKHRISIVDNTSRMVNPAPNRFYYSITGYGGCADEFYQSDPGNGYKLVELLNESVKLGEVILFYYLDDGYYEEIAHNVHSYINITKQVKTSLDDFLLTFLTQQFEGNEVVYVIT